MEFLSKSKIMAFRQCHKRLWLEVNKPELREDSSASMVSFVVGHKVGAIAQQIYDPKGRGQLIDVAEEGVRAAIARTPELLQTRRPVFEAGFAAQGALAFADVMLPVTRAGKPAWRMVEVKSSTKVKDYHRDDAAVQAMVALASGVQLASISLAHIDSSWVYQGDGNYAGLLVEEDLSDEAFARNAEAQAWVVQAHAVAAQAGEPALKTGSHCSEPYECGFAGYCSSNEPQAQRPVHWLPGARAKGLKEFLAQKEAEAARPVELGEVPDALLNAKQLRVKTQTLMGAAYFDAASAAQALFPHKLPAYFVDFETINLAVPVWKGTRPYQQVPFQFSAHRLTRTGRLEHAEFIDLSGGDPSRGFAEALIEACGVSGPVFVYNAPFERGRIEDLAGRFKPMAARLLAINARIVDLLPIARDHYYHPSQEGSWSIKKVLPAVCPDLDYSQLEGVQDGGMAMEAFAEAIAAGTAVERKAEIERHLLAYCKLDTYAMVRLWQFFAGRGDMAL
jgi:hypothetical protein